MKALPFLPSLLLGGLAASCAQGNMNKTQDDAPAPMPSPDRSSSQLKLNIYAKAIMLAQMREPIYEALDDLSKIDLIIDDGQIQNARADADQLLADLVNAEQYVQTHPEIPLPPPIRARIFEPRPKDIQLPSYVPPHEMSYFSQTLSVIQQDRTEIVSLTLAKPNGQGLLIGADGKLLNAYLLMATNSLDLATHELIGLIYSQYDRHGAADGDLGNYRAKLTTDQGQMSSDLLAAIANVHDHVAPANDLAKPTVVKFHIINGVINADDHLTPFDELPKPIAVAQPPPTSRGSTNQTPTVNPTVTWLNIKVIATPTTQTTKPLGGRSIQMLGEFHHPGWVVIPSEKNLTLASAVAEAGEPLPSTDGYVTITRNLSDGTSIVFNDVDLYAALGGPGSNSAFTGDDFALQDGDTVASFGSTLDWFHGPPSDINPSPQIRILSRQTSSTAATDALKTKPEGGRSINVIGQVNNPGWQIIPPDKNMCLSSAIIYANGPTLMASRYATVSRPMPDGTTKTFNNIDMQAAMTGSGPDFPLEDGDTISLSIPPY